MAFGLAALGAGIGLGFVGAAGLAAISDNPKMQSRVFIIVGMVESIAIYGIVMMFTHLGPDLRESFFYPLLFHFQTERF